MAGLRFTELQSRPMAFLDFTSVTLEEFQQLVPPFEAAFHARIAAWRMDGKPRLARQFTVHKNCSCRRRKTDYCLFWPTEKPIRSRWSRGACSVWCTAKRIKITRARLTIFFFNTSTDEDLFCGQKQSCENL
jgi:hypothetical protein